jgi:hypothetical protein
VRPNVVSDDDEHVPSVARDSTRSRFASSSSFPSPLARVAVDDARVSTDRGRAPVPRHAGHARAHATRRAKNVPLSLVPVVFIVVGVIVVHIRPRRALASPIPSIHPSPIHPWASIDRSVPS